MIKNICSVFIVALAIAFSISCNQTGTGNASLPKNDASGNPPFKTGVTPQPDAEVAVIEMENAAYGKITIELYSNIAPKMVEQFKALIKEGVFNGTTFHRINASVIQGGDPLSKDGDPRNDGTGKSDKPNVQAEFSDIPYDTGIVGAARSSDINSQNSQFFITLKREAAFDKRYTIFGKVIDGMGNARTIAGVSPKEGERPMEAVRIKTITLQPRP